MTSHDALLRGIFASERAISSALAEEHADCPREDVVHADLGTAVMWLCLAEECLWQQPGYEQRREACEEGQTCEGLRFLRNQLVHRRVAMAVPTTGMSFPMEFPMEFRYRFVWSDDLTLAKGTQLSEKRAQRQFQQYLAHLAGRSATKSLSSAAAWIRATVDTVET